MLGRTLLFAVALTAAACSTPPVAALTVHSGARSESLTAAQLAELPRAAVTVNEVERAGPRLREALQLAGVPGGVDVTAIGADGYRQVINAATVARDDVIVTTAADQSLRLIVPGSPGLSVRQLIALEAAP